VDAEELPDAIELTVLTGWQSMDAIRAFAGDDAARAVFKQVSSPRSETSTSS
jgi:heme-degrading monooxygenase HmoA